MVFINNMFLSLYLFVLQVVAASCYSYPANFTYIINQPDLCQTVNSNKTIEVIAFVHSRPEEAELRQAVRNSWAQPEDLDRAGFKVFFMLGLPNDTSYISQLVNESDVHGDIIVADFTDTYHNLSFKALAGFQWIRKYCLSVEHPPLFVMKVDSDTFVDIPGVVQRLNTFLKPTCNKTTPLATNRKVIFGNILSPPSRVPVRDNSSKHYVSEEIYPDKLYPGKP